MARLNCTVDQLVKAVRQVYDQNLQWIPTKVWIDELHCSHTYLRATFQNGYTNGHLDRLLTLRNYLQVHHGNAEITVVVYPTDFPAEQAEARNTLINAVP
jgi:hypothetical protein